MGAQATTRMTMRKKIIITTIIILIAAILFLIHYHREHAKKNTVIAPILVHVQTPIQKTIPETISATGYLIAINSASISPRTTEYISAIKVHEGEAVKAGQVLFELNNQNELQALHAAKAAVSLNQLQYDQNKNLVKKGFVSKSAFYTAKANLKQAISSLQTAQINLENCTVTAPFDGTVGSLPVSIGQNVSPTTTLTTLVDNQHLRVEYTVPAKYLNQIQLKQTLNIKGADGKNTLSASVSYISPSVDQTTQDISVHAHVNNIAQKFKPGEYVSITQDIGAQKNRLLIPEQSVMASINGYSVFVAEKNKAKRVEVKLGQHISGNVIVLSGLKMTDQVIVAGQDELKSGQAITVIKK